MAQAENSFVTPDQLQIGMYVHLDMKWFEHPFAFGSFKIKDAEQIRIIRGLRLQRVRYDPARSDAAPPATLPAGVPAPPEAAAPGEAEDAEQQAERLQALAAKRALIEKLRAQRETVARIDTAFLDTARTIRDIERNLQARPEEAIEQAGALVGRIAESILAAPDLAIHVMGDKMGGEETYLHSLNVTMLSLMVARDIGLPPESARFLGLGGLFHDLGLREIPDKILMKLEPLTQAERNYYELHCQYGVDTGRTLKLPPPVLAIIHEHHEMIDGSGYPRKLKGEQLDPLARIVAIANHYDELCNPVNILNALTPHEALATLFARLRARFDAKLLQTFVRCLGVYPPGTVVQLANDAIGMVVTVNTAKPMKPMVMVYDPAVPKEEAILVDLDGEDDVNIAKAIRPAQLPREIYNYLSPRRQLSYYFDPGAPTGDAASG